MKERFEGMSTEDRVLAAAVNTELLLDEAASHAKRIGSLEDWRTAINGGIRFLAVAVSLLTLVALALGLLQAIQAFGGS